MQTKSNIFLSQTSVTWLDLHGFIYFIGVFFGLLEVVSGGLNCFRLISGGFRSLLVLLSATLEKFLKNF